MGKHLLRKVMIANKLKRISGVSIVEVLIATTIFSITFLSFTAIQISSLDTVRDGFIKKIVTDTGNSFVTQFNTDLTTQKSTPRKNDIINFYKDSEWNVSNAKCPASNDLVKPCYSKENLDDETICTKEERIKLNVSNFQCDLLQNIPSSRSNFEKCNESSSLYCLTVSWNGDKNDYASCKELSSNCLIFEVLP